jgi:N-acetyl-gamma-glutamyl-phosphate reductase
VVVQQTQQFNACIACATDDAYFYDVAILDECDVIFFATPHGVAMKGAGAFIEKGIKVIDLGADFRLNDKVEYQQWYELEHTQDDLLSSAIYGLCEINHNDQPKMETSCLPVAQPLNEN